MPIQQAERMSPSFVDVFGNGAVSLGTNIVCDGYVEGFGNRIQTHVHDDHMFEFNRSKGFQDLFMSQETYELLIAERNADLEYRSNLISVPWGEEHILEDGSKLSLLPSNHMLGSCQVQVEFPQRGIRCGYSGDFAWPIDNVMQVDQLVVDSTYGSPTSVRRYTQNDAETCLQEIVCGSLRFGPVHIKAHRGTIERVLHVLSGNVGVPILVSATLNREIAVYQHHGYATDEVEVIESVTGKSALRERSYIRLYSKGDSFGNTPPEGSTSVICSAYLTQSDNPLLRITNRSYHVAMSNHADFEGTIAYVEATGANLVVTDNTRNHGIDLAIAITDRLNGVRAIPSSNRSASKM